MVAIGIMLVGVLIGKLLFSDKQKKLIEKIQFICIIGLIFLMGVTLGNTEGFLNDLVSTGFMSMLYAVVPILFSIILVFILTRLAFVNKERTK